MSGWSKGILIALGLLAIAALSVPWWLGAAARPLAAKFHTSIGRYERTGFRSFTLHDVRFARGSTTVTIGRVEGVNPLLWAWAQLRGSERQLKVFDWKVTVTRAEPPEPAATAERRVRGLPSLHAQLNRVANQLEKYLPEIFAENGVIEVRGRNIQVPKARWQDGTLLLEAARFKQAETDLQLARAANEVFVLRADSPPSQSSAELRWAAHTVAGFGRFWDQPWNVAAEFADEGWWPASGTLKAPDWDLPAERVRLENGYSRVTGAVEVTWNGTDFLARATADARPREEKNAPPLQVRVEAHGDKETIRVSALQIESEFGRGVLTGPLEFAYNGELRSEPATLTVSGDLARMPWFDAAGSFEGRVTFDGRGAKTHGDFDLAGKDIVFGEMRGRLAKLRGSWSIPEINVAEARVEIDEHTTLNGRGLWNWRTQQLDAVSVNGRLAAESLRQWLPADLAWEQAEIDVRLHGEVRAPAHEGSVRAVGFKAKSLHPASLHAQWQGVGGEARHVTLSANSGEAQLTGTAAFRAGTLEVGTFTLRRSDNEKLTLAAPARIRFRPTFAVHGLRLAGGKRSLAVSGSFAAGASVEIAASAIDDQWVRDWMVVPGPRWNVRDLRLTGKQSDEELTFELMADTEVRVREENVQLTLKAMGGEAGLRITELLAAQTGKAFTRGSGELPVRFSLAPRPRFTVQQDGPLAVNAVVGTDSALWPLLTEFTGIKLQEATASADLKGTLNSPLGLVQVKIGAAEPVAREAAAKFPPISQLELTARAAADAIVLESFSGKLAGQPVRATARLPLSPGAWEQIRTNPRSFDWERTEATVQTENVDLGELSRAMPAIPFTKGRLNAAVTLAGGSLTGNLQFFNALSRPIPGMGVLQDVHADVGLDGRTLTISAFRGELGSEPVDLSGTIALDDIKKPRLALTLKGRNLPLVRRPGLLVRTDLDLRAETNPAGITSIRGVVELRDSLVLADLAAILPGGPRGVGRQPPYFAVSLEPFDEWPLRVDVRGSRAVRIRTAVFNGVASANFDLTGTLGEPKAIGQLSVDEGRVLFPFATFEVQNGAVRISEADPHRLQLALNAAARRHGYELRLEATGTLSSPAITLSSNPPLEAAEVLLMVTTGQPPADDSAATTNQQRLTQLGAYVGKGILQNFGVGGSETRLEISSGEDVSRQGRETYQLEYRLNDRWALTGEYDEFDQYNAGVKWRVYEQAGKDNERKERDEKK